MTTLNPPPKDAMDWMIKVYQDNLSNPFPEIHFSSKVDQDTAAHEIKMEKIRENNIMKFKEEIEF